MKSLASGQSMSFNINITLFVVITNGVCCYCSYHYHRRLIEANTMLL